MSPPSTVTEAGGRPCSPVASPVRSRSKRPNDRPNAAQCSRSSSRRTRSPTRAARLPQAPPQTAFVEHPATARVDHDDPHRAAWGAEGAPEAPLDALGLLVGPDGELAEHVGVITGLEHLLPQLVLGEFGRGQVAQ